MRRIALAGVFLATLTLANIVYSQTGRGEKYAFLVVCSKYNNTRLKDLPYAIEEMEDFKKALLKTGFNADHIILLHDNADRERVPEKAKIEKQFRLLLNGLQANDTVIVAINGHGVHYKGDKVGYFCPLGANLERKDSLVSMEFFYELLKKSKARQKLMVVQACQNDPFIDNAFAAERLEFAEKADTVPEGVAAIFSCMEGQRSYYDPDRKRGLFFDHVIRSWNGEYLAASEKKLTLEDFFRQVRVKTKADALKFKGGVEQVPEIRREYKGEWLIASSAVPLRPPINPSGAGKLQFKAFDRVGVPFFEETTTDTRQTIVVSGQEVKQFTKLTFLQQWIPKEKNPDSNWVVTYRIIGVKFETDTGGNKVSYDSTIVNPKGPVTELFDGMVTCELTYVIKPNLTIKSIEGREEFVKKLSDTSSPAMKDLINSMLREDAVFNPGGFLSFPPDGVIPDGPWQRESRWNLGPLGSYKSSNTFTYLGTNAGRDRIGIETKLTYQAPTAASKMGESFFIRQARLGSTAGAGEAVFDRVLGRFESMKSHMKLSGDLQIEIKGMVTDVTLNQTQETTLIFTSTNPWKRP